MATPNVVGMVSDQEFQKLSPEDQQATLGHIDPEFGKLPPEDFQATVSALQKKGVSRPDLTPPPSISRPSVNMKQVQLASGTSAQGNEYRAPEEESTPQGHENAVERRETAVPGGAAGQFAIGVAKSGRHIPLVDSLSRYASGDTEHIPSEEPRGTAQNLGNAAGITAMVAPGIVANPLGTVGALVGGTVGNYGGRRLVKTLGGGENAQALGGDIGGITGGIAGGYGGNSIRPAPDSLETGIATGGKRPGFFTRGQAIGPERPAVTREEIPATPNRIETPQEIDLRRSEMMQRVWAVSRGETPAAPDVPRVGDEFEQSMQGARVARTPGFQGEAPAQAEPKEIPGTGTPARTVTTSYGRAAKPPVLPSTVDNIQEQIKAMPQAALDELHRNPIRSIAMILTALGVPLGGYGIHRLISGLAKPVE